MGKRRDKSMSVRSPTSSRYRRRAITRLLARDGATCALCGGELVRKLPDNDPNQTTIDHVVPISKGGGDEDANLRLAHARCNHARGNALDAGPW